MTASDYKDWRSHQDPDWRPSAKGTTNSDSPQPSLREILHQYWTRQNHNDQAHMNGETTADQRRENLDAIDKEAVQAIQSLLASAKLERTYRMELDEAGYVEGYNQGAAAQYAAIWQALIGREK